MVQLKYKLITYSLHTSTFAQIAYVTLVFKAVAFTTTNKLKLYQQHRHTRNSIYQQGPYKASIITHIKPRNHLSVNNNKILRACT